MQEKFIFKKIEGGVSLTEYVGDDDKKIVIPDTFEGDDVIAIGISAFMSFVHSNPNAINVTEIVLPARLKTIGSYAFIEFLSLEKIVFPDTLEEIKRDSFYQCTSLKEIVLPAKVIKIGSSSFRECTSLVKVTALNEDMVLGKNAFLGCDSLQDVSLHLIKSLDLDNQVMLLQEYFNQWDELEIDIKDIIITLCKKKALKNALFLSSNVNVIIALLSEKFKLKLDDVNDYLEHYIKLKNTSVTAILLDYKEKNFSKKQVDTLQKRNELVEIGLELPTFTEFRKMWLCSKKDGEIRVSGYKGTCIQQTIPKTITDGTPITELFLSDNGSYSNLETLHIQADLTSLGFACFRDCVKLTEIILPDSLTEIPTFGFYACNSLKKIHLPENLEIIRYKAFVYCESLEEIVIPASVMIIEERAFWLCKSLKKVTYLGDTPDLVSNVFLDTPYGENN